MLPAIAWRISASRRIRVALEQRHRRHDDARACRSRTGCRRGRSAPAAPGGESPAPRQPLDGRDLDAARPHRQERDMHRRRHHRPAPCNCRNCRCRSLPWCRSSWSRSRRSSRSVSRGSARTVCCSPLTVQVMTDFCTAAVIPEPPGRGGLRTVASARRVKHGDEVAAVVGACRGCRRSAVASPCAAVAAAANSGRWSRGLPISARSADGARSGVGATEASAIRASVIDARRSQVMRAPTPRWRCPFHGAA